MMGLLVVRKNECYMGEGGKHGGKGYSCYATGVC